MARILLLPGSKWQVALAQKVKQLGHWLCVVSPEDNPPCALIADEFYCADIFSIDKIEKHALDINIEAIVTDECDIAMPVIAELGRRLRLPAISNEAAELYTDKFRMREFGMAHGIKTPEYRLCETVDEVIDFLSTIGKSIIIKPVDSNASHGVFKIDNSDEAIEHFHEAMSFSRGKKAVLAERFITGTEFTIDGIKTPTAHYTLAISEKRHFAHNISIANELYFTHTNEKFDYEKMKRINDLFVMESPLLFGFTHAEYKCEDGEFYLIEIGARGGGNMISSLITQYMSGHDTYRYLINSSLGLMSSETFYIPEDHKKRAAVLKFFSTPQGGGKVLKIKGIDFLKSSKNIPVYQLNFSIGDNICDAHNDSARIGFYIACSDDKNSLDAIISEVNEKFKIIIK